MNGDPVVWALLSDKGGDNAQVQAVIDRLPWPVETRRLTFKRPFIKGKPPFLASLYHIDRTRSDELEPPWPDAILTIGRRPAMAAHWVRNQSRGHSRIVLFGRPKRNPANYALIVVSAQFKLPVADNIVHTALPLMRIDSQRLADAATQWAQTCNAMPRPLIAVLVGGATAPFSFGGETAQTLMQVARAYCGANGSLYVTSSRRTGADAVAQLRADLPPGSHLYRWGDPPPNPYLGLLAHADGFVVTGDSMSMITEVASLARPLAIFPLPLAPWRRHIPRFVHAGIDWLKYELLPRLGWNGYPRDLTEVHRTLIERGLAVPAGAPLRAPLTRLEDEIEQVAGRVCAAIAK
jgi:mitochondrial fission protein ELM1